MPRKAKTPMSKTPVPVPSAKGDCVDDGNTELGNCRKCKCQRPVKSLAGGLCGECRPIETIKTDALGGLTGHQRRENYHGQLWAKVYISTATRKPRVGQGIGPPHWLDTPAIRLSDILGVPPGSPKGSHRGRGKCMLRPEFMKIQITDADRRHLTAKELDAMDLFLAGHAITEIARRFGVTKSPIRKRLQSALRKLKGGNRPVILMTDKQLEALEAQGQVVATL